MLARILDRIRKLKGRSAVVSFIVPIAVAAVSAVVWTLAVYNFAALTNAEQFLADLQVAGIAPAELQDTEIVIVAITEDTLKQFPYRAPVDRQFVSDLVTTLAKAGPRAIGLDLLIDQPTEAAKDDALRKTLSTVLVPLVVSYVQIESVVNEDQSAFLDEFVPAKLRGLANVAEDQFDVVRWVYPGAMARDSGYIMSFPRALAGKLGVKTSPDVIAIVWHGRPGETMEPFSEIPAHTVTLLPPALFKDKIVLIGTDITLIDRHRTPFNTLDASGEGMAGVVVQAHALSQLLRGRRAPGVSWPVNFAVALALGALGAALGAVALPLVARVGAGLMLVLFFWSGGAALFHFGGPMVGLISPTLSLAMSFFAMEALSGSEARAQREFIRGVFSHHVAPKVVDQLLNDPERVTSLEGERRTMTFLFTDVADFTSMSENVESKELGRILNLYLEGMTEIVQKHGGMVDKFIGDAVFAIFNAPIDQPDHAAAAVGCALEMDRFSQGFSNAQHAADIPFGRTRIGIHTGSAVIGNFGSRTRHNYTASGDAVNTASRLEGLNKHFGTRLSVSGETRALCASIRFRPTASVVVKGRKGAIELFEPLQDDDRRDGFIARYCEAYAKLKASAPEAKEMFEALAEEEPDDPSVAFHLGRIRHGAMGVAVIMTEK
jgi:adenylate cyclase